VPRPRLSIAAAAASCAFALALAGCGSDDGASSTGGGSGKDFELKLGVLAPLTGDLGPFGPSAEKGAKLAVATLRQALRKDGSKISVTTTNADTESSPQAALDAARKVVSDGASCLVGPYASSESVTVAQSVSRRSRIPTISPSSTSASLTSVQDGGFFNRTAPSDNLQAVALADFVQKSIGAQGATISLAGRNDAYGEGLANSFKAEWERRGGKIAGPILYDPDQPSYNTEADKIVAAPADGIVIIDFPETYIKMGAALLRTGKFGTDRLFVTDGLAADTMPKGIPTASLDGARGTRAGTPASTEAATRFDQMWKSAGGADRYTYDAQLFDATILCGLASVAAGSTDGPAIEAKLRAVSAPPGRKYTYLQLDKAIADLRAGKDIDYEGVSGPIDLDEHGDPTAATYEIWKYVHGKLTVLRHVVVNAG
jgi:ABC-type branched-subunit amino acid transport system substrate-binding protein